MGDREDHGPASRPPRLADKKGAQRRVDQIRAFKRELSELEQEGVIELPPEQRSRLDAHLERTLAELAGRFDVDVSDSQKRLSLGMRILSALGGLAFCLALVLFFYRVWGDLSTTLQVVLLGAAPILLLAATEWVSRREKTKYYTALLGLVTCAAFALNLAVTGATFNVRPTPHAILVWGAFALIVAYTHGLRLPAAGGLLALAIYFGAVVMHWSGEFWANFGERPDHFILAGAAVAVAPMFVRHRKLVDFPVVYRLIGLLLAFLAVEILMHQPGLSHLPLSITALKAISQVVAFATAGLVVWLGIRRDLSDLVNLGSGAFAVYLFDRMISWWWDWMPRYLFFLIIGIMTLIFLLVFRKLRMRSAERRTS